MEGPFHAGELEMQRRAGVVAEARDLGRIVRDEIPAGAQRFLDEQPFAVAASRDATGRVWASPLFGLPGFLQVIDAKLLRIASRPPDADPLAANLASPAPLGVLVIDPRTRRRMRFNGRALLRPEGVFLDVRQAYGNCPKYIQRRVLDPERRREPAGAPRIADRLNEEQRDFVRCSDTFFIASFAPGGGADASHRGGFPGFVRATSPDTLEFDDYPGNGMFNTLGNLHADGRAGLLFVDFESGDLLQLTGRALVRDDFSVHVRVESVRATPRGSPLRFHFVDYSPANPAIATADPGRQEETG
jgi:predicted pyridoxine 5'-phosphate oxidase superfamily flavin-nucleotide-binding protein